MNDNPLTAQTASSYLDRFNFEIVYEMQETEMTVSWVWGKCLAVMYVCVVLPTYTFRKGDMVDLFISPEGTLFCVSELWSNINVHVLLIFFQFSSCYFALMKVLLPILINQSDIKIVQNCVLSGCAAARRRHAQHEQVMPHSTAATPQHAALQHTTLYIQTALRTTTHQSLHTRAHLATAPRRTTLISSQCTRQCPRRHQQQDVPAQNVTRTFTGSRAALAELWPPHSVQHLSRGRACRGLETTCWVAATPSTDTHSLPILAKNEQ